LRVGTMSAGNNWGSIFIPRIGMDVIVSFLEGDPDRPIIVGCVYNPDQMPPYTLPDKKTVSTVKSHSTLGGGKDNYNELRFEDLKGKEQVFIQAERDMDERVKNESRLIVGANRHETIGKSLQEDIGENWHTNVGKDLVLAVGGDHAENLQGASSTKVGSNHQVKTGEKFAYDAGTEIHLKAGMKVVIEAGVQLSLVASGNFVDIGPAGVTIQGTMVLINSGGAAGTGSGSSPNVPAPKKPDTADDGTKFDKL
jgi:type VI secretion system secreted protein VgrG